MNQVFLIGRLTKDTELRTTQNGTEVCSFTLAVSRKYENNNGEKETDFINCKAFNKVAEIINKYTLKGSQIAIQGRIQTGSYEKEGTKVYTTDVIVSDVMLLGSKQEKLSDSQVIQKAMNEEPDPFSAFGDEMTLSDDDLPF